MDYLVANWPEEVPVARSYTEEVEICSKTIHRYVYKKQWFIFPWYSTNKNWYEWHLTHNPWLTGEEQENE